MVTLFGTLGFSPKKFLGAIPAVGARIERAMVYTAADTATDVKRSDAAFGEVRNVLEAVGIRCEHRTFTSPWKFDEIARAFIQDLSREDPQHVVFNLTGGPKTMTVAATIACMVYGVRALYVPEESGGTGAPFVLPLLRIRYSQILTETQAKLIEAVGRHGPRTLDELAEIMRRSNATITFHAQRLENLGALTFQSDSKNRLIRSPQVTFAGEIMLLAEQALSRDARQRGTR